MITVKSVQLEPEPIVPDLFCMDGVSVSVRPRALVHLDKLGDMQAEAGRLEDARATIRVIIALNPPNVAEYQQILEQL